jgi:hypothetical protein
MFEWKVMSNAGSDGLFYQVWRQTRMLERGEPMHSGVREIRGHYDTSEEAQQAADKLNAE